MWRIHFDQLRSCWTSVKFIQIILLTANFTQFFSVIVSIDKSWIDVESYAIIAVYQVYIYLYIHSECNWKCENRYGNSRVFWFCRNLYHCAHAGLSLISRNNYRCPVIMCRGRMLQQWLKTVWIHPKNGVMSSWPERGSQMTEQGIKRTSHVTSCQIIVEQAIRSGKTFKLVHNEVPVTHIFALDKLLKVICVICNLWRPLST